MGRELKPISFNSDTKSDKEILEYIETLGVSFGAYVKILIRKDMMSSKLGGNDISEIAFQLKELVGVFREYNINNRTNDTIINSTSEKEDVKNQRIAMENLMQLGGKMK